MELDLNETTPEEEMLVLDMLVTDGLVEGDPELRPHLDEWSSRAISLGPTISTLVGSRGAVLAQLGRYAEAKTLLDRAASAPDPSATDRFLNSLFLARAEHGLGNIDVARTLMARARELIVPTPAFEQLYGALIRSIEAELESSVAAQAPH